MTPISHTVEACIHVLGDDGTSLLFGVVFNEKPRSIFVARTVAEAIRLAFEDRFGPNYRINTIGVE